ncbi:hypothetical protein IAR55_003596 [Kwoniella newhampshirensis]|uniref:Uncharacterized protein n=1 Tax=Kwoniella newhampshirensis TaxID=1651941 RepID=A0AAW0YYX2_9TREE
MEFIPSSATAQDKPKNIYPCLATITINSPSSEPRNTRRLSTGSFGSDGGGAEGNALQRVISGGRRKSSFGPIAVDSNAPGGGAMGSGRRRSFGIGTGGGGVGEDEGKGIEGKWYWRVQAGVTDTHLVVLPLTDPANPVLTTPPAPLSHAMPSHSTHAAAGTRTEGGGSAGTSEEDTGMVAKMKNLFRRTSTTNTNTNTNTSGNPSIRDTIVTQEDNSSSAFGTAHTATSGSKEEKVIDQTPRGEMLPSAKGNAIGATNVNSNAELGWPGMIQGEKLGGILVSLHGVEKGKVTLGGGKKGEGSWVTVPITSHFSNLVHPMLESVGFNKHDNFPKSGTIKFEFDKEWIGAKGEAELLHHYITKALESLPSQPSHAERSPPQPTNFQLGGGNFPQQTFADDDNAAAGAGDRPIFVEDVAPEDSVTSSRSGKVGGE